MSDPVVFDEWRPGVSGSDSPFLKRGRGSYRGSNAQVYRNGSLGPRPGWNLLAHSGNDWVASTDTPRGILWRRDATGGSDQGDIIFAYENGANTYLELGALNSTGTQITWGGKLTRTTSDFPLLNNSYGPVHVLDKTHWMWYDGVETTIIGGEIFENFDTSSPTSYHHNVSGAGTYAAGAMLYRERAYYFGYAANPGRIYFSDAADYATVGALSYFDVAPDPTLASSAVVGCWSINNAMLIARRDGRWFVLTGTSPENGTLREMAYDTVPAHPGSATVMDDQLWYPSPDGEGIDIANPGEVDSQSLDHLTPFEVPGAALTVYNAQEPQEAAADIVNKAMMLSTVADSDGGSGGAFYLTTFINGSWGYEEYSSDTSAADHTSISLTNGPRGRVFLMTAQDDDTWEFLSRNYTLNRPVNTLYDAWSELQSDNQTTNSAATVYLPQIPAPPGQLVRPVGVEIEYDYWKQGTTDTPQITVTPWVYGVDDDSDPDVQVTSVTESGSGWATTANGLDPRRRRLQSSFVNAPFGASVEMYLLLQGVAVHRVTVFVETQDDPRAR